MSDMRRIIDITQEQIDRYGRINGDNDIIHYDHAYALGRGFRGTLAHGLHMAAFAADLAAKRLGRDWFYKGHLHAKLIGPVCPGDHLVVDLREDGAVEERVGQDLVVVGRAELTRD